MEENKNKNFKFTEYDFIRLYCAVIIKTGNTPVLEYYELEKELYKFYNDSKFKILFDNIKIKKNYINIKNSHLLLDTGFEIAKTIGLLSPSQDDSNNRFLICCNEEQAQQMILSYNEDMVYKMYELLDKLEKLNENKQSEKNKKHKMTVLAVPCNRAFIVAPDKVDAFKNSTNSKEDNEEISRMAEEFRRNLIISEPGDTPKVKKLGKKEDKK